MNKRICLPLILGIACLIFVSIQKSEAAKPIFFADFDGKGIPNDGVNDAGNWKAENPSNTWGIGEFPANGTKALKMTASGCGSSGFTPFPTVENWTDGIIQADFGWFDDDSWGIMFRRKDETTGYFAFFGFTETLSLALFDLAEGCGINGKCLSETGCEQGPDGSAEAVEDKAIKVVPHNLPKRDQTGNTSYTARILAEGPKIRIWYGLTKDFPEKTLTPRKWRL